MNKIKRQLSNEICLNKDIKKLRTIIGKEKNSINCIENFSNELFLEIFDYLEGCSLYQAFSNLNNRFQHLLNSSLIRLKIIFDSNSESIWEYNSKYFIIPNKHQIISFYFHNTIKKSSILSWFPIDSTFNRLESLILTDIQSDELPLLLVGLIHLPRLFSLTIRLDEQLLDLSFIYKLIFNLPKLKYTKISSNTTNLNLSSLINIRSQFSPIEYLIIDHICTINDLIIILLNIPRLSYLICKQSIKSNLNIKQTELIKLTNLIHLSIRFEYLRFDEFEIFIKKISSNLHVLKLFACRDANYLNANRWEQLIQQYIPYLNKFKFLYVEMINENLEVTPYHEHINQFNSSFWIKKQWLFRLDIRSPSGLNTAFLYNIFPRRNRSMHSYNYKITNKYFISNTNQNSIQEIIIPYQNKSLSSSFICNPLFIYNLSVINNTKIFFDIIRRILSLSQINVINIKCDEIFIGTLIELIRLLPQLDILIINSLTMIQSRYLSNEEIIDFHYISNNNKITKVILQQMTELAQVQFLINLCPCLQYLEVTCFNNIHPETFLRFILMKNTKYIKNLHSIGICILKKDEKLMEKLQQIIDMERLCQDYIIKQIDNKIYLKWNNS